MPRRSVLFSPGDQPELMHKAPSTDADVVVFDLEDAVAPAATADARDSVRTVLTDEGFAPEAEVVVRLAEPATDLEALFAGAEPTLDAVMVPKVAGADEAAAVAEQCGEYDPTLDVFALVESAAGVLAVPDVAAVEGVSALVFGAEDYAADVGATRTDDGDEVLYARERVVAAAAAHGVDAVDTLVTDFEDRSKLQTDAQLAVQLGYDGKLAVHPGQVPVINDAFTPTEAEIEWAETVLAAREDADGAVFEVDGEMIDAPLLAQAERILDRADRSVEGQE
ncbi:MAG: CoA ester lyase [Halolamina sp.]